MPRNENVATIEFIDEMTNVSHLLENFVLVKNGYFLQFEQDMEFDFLIDGHTYRMNAYDVDGNTLYRDKVICTNQSIENYSVNNGDYVANTTTNDFVIYE